MPTHNPILTKKIVGINGPGHGDLVMDADKKMSFVFHTHYSDSTVFPRKAAIIQVRFSKADKAKVDNVTVVPKTFSFLKLNTSNAKNRKAKIQ